MSILRAKLLFLMAALCLAACTASAQALAIPDVEAIGETKEKAMDLAFNNAVLLALTQEKLPADEASVAKVLKSTSLLLSRSVVSMENLEGKVKLVVTFNLNKSVLQSAFVKQDVAQVSEALDHPKLAFAIVPLIKNGKTLDAAAKRDLIQKVNTALAKVFKQNGFEVTQPEWLSKELNAFQGDPAHTEELDLNVRYQAKQDFLLHYLVSGTASIETTANGAEYEAHLSIDANVYNTFTGNSSIVPLQYNVAVLGKTESLATAQAASLLGERAARSEAVPAVVDDWKSSLSKGMSYPIHLVYDTPAFKNTALKALQAAGKIEDIANLSSQLMRISFRTKAAARSDFGDEALLRTRLTAWPDNVAFMSAFNNSEIVIAPDNPASRSMALAIVNGQKYTLYDLEKLKSSVLPPAVAPKTPVNTAPSQPAQNVLSADDALALNAKKFGRAVGVVTYVYQEGLDPSATAWAFGPRLFASNAHVTEDIKKKMSRNIPAYIFLNQAAGQRVRITRAISHPKYLSSGGDYDIGIIEVAEAVDTYFELADQSHLAKVEAGHRVAYVGFPMEGIRDGNVNLSSVVATFHSGIITAVSDFKLRGTDFSSSHLYRHSLPTVGGASGSPIFDVTGKVIAVHNAGSYHTIQAVDTSTGKKETTRIPLGVIRYGQRIDLLNDITR